MTVFLQIWIEHKSLLQLFQFRTQVNFCGPWENVFLEVLVETLPYLA